MTSSTFILNNNAKKDKSILLILRRFVDFVEYVVMNLQISFFREAKKEMLTDRRPPTEAQTYTTSSGSKFYYTYMTLVAKQVAVARMAGAIIRQQQWLFFGVCVISLAIYKRTQNYDDFVVGSGWCTYYIQLLLLHSSVYQFTDYIHCHSAIFCCCDRHTTFSNCA